MCVAQPYFLPVSPIELLKVTLKEFICWCVESCCFFNIKQNIFSLSRHNFIVKQDYFYHFKRLYLKMIWL
jgi:hypothetical protein